MKPQTIMNTPPAKMADVADNLSGPEMREAVDALQHIALSAVWRYAYLDARYGNGCGDQGHDAAVRDANRQMTACRKAMGFSYPAAAAIHV